MSEKHITKRSAEMLNKGKTDFARVDAMTDEEIETAMRDDPDWADLMDIDWSKGMARAWEQIALDPAVSCSIDLGKFGLCLCLDERFAQPRRFKLALEDG